MAQTPFNPDDDPVDLNDPTLIERFSDLLDAATDDDLCVVLLVSISGGRIALVTNAHEINDAVKVVKAFAETAEEMPGELH
jgi:hypothetical protein